MASAADVPNKFDVVINGQGYMLDNSYDDSPYRKPPALYGYTPTFLERTNVGQVYGDDQQDFFLTETQKDWSGGEGRNFFRPDDAAGATMYDRSHDVETSIPGQVTVTAGTNQVTGMNSIIASCGDGTVHYMVDATTLYKVDSAGTKTSLGAHGAGTPCAWGLATDGVYVYISGATKLRKWNIGTPAFSDFGTNANVGALCYSGNLLYSCDGSVLNSYTGAGVATLIFTWKDATATARVAFVQKPRIVPFGSNIMILFPYVTNGPELWKYDGTNTNLAAHLPAGSMAYDMVELDGNLYCSGVMQGPQKTISSAPTYINGQLQTLWAYSAGGVEIVWQELVIALGGAPAWNSAAMPPLGTYRDSVVFQGISEISGGSVSYLKTYTPSTGVVQTLSVLLCGTATTRQISSNKTDICFTGAAADSDGYVIPHPSNNVINSTGKVFLSRFDFGNSLQKMFRSVKVDWAHFPTDSGAQITIAVAVDDGTTFATSFANATAGVEYLLPSTYIGRYLQVTITLSVVASTWGPVIHRVYARAAPILQSYRNNTYLLDLTGNKRAEPPLYLTLVDQSTHTKDGDEMRADLVTALQAGPVSITDRFGTFTGIIEAGPTNFREVRSDYGRAEYRGEIVVREI